MVKVGTTKKLDLNRYELIIFDWDGTLVDSLSAYEAWDKQYVEKFYGVDLPIEYFKDLAGKMKKIDPGRSENQYFRYLDELYGAGNTAIDQIWENIYSLAPEIQSKIEYKKDAPELLKRLKQATKAHITLATNSEQRDIAFFSSESSCTARHILPTHYFDKIITLNDVDNPKPHPESFQKIIDHFSVDPKKVLIFEDSVHGVVAAKAAGADVVLFNDNNLEIHDIAGKMDYIIKGWREVIELLNR